MADKTPIVYEALGTIPETYTTREMVAGETIPADNIPPTGNVDLSDYETTTQLNTRDTNNRDRANHSGTQLAATISDFTGAVNALITGKADQSAVDTLNTAVASINTLLASDDTALDEMQEIVDFIKINKSTLDALNIASIAGLQTALDGKMASSHGTDTANPHSVTAAQVGLGSVDNTSDAGKPVSTAQQAAIDQKEPLDAATKVQSLGNITVSEAVDLSSGRAATATVTGDVTISFTGLVAGTANESVLSLTNAGAHTITWPAGIAWDSGTAPTFQAAGSDRVSLITYDDGANWQATHAWSSA